MTIGRHIAVIGFGLAVCLGSARATAPANDNFANRIALASGPVTVLVDTFDATSEANEPAPFVAGNQTVWWTWTASASGSVKVSTAGTFYETVVGVYKGTALGSLTTVATNHTVGSGASSVTFSAVSGQQYVIAEGTVGGGGQIYLEISVGTSLATITSQPQGTGVATGQTMGFNAGATAAGGLTLSYQWYQNGILLFDGTQTTPPIAGEVVSGSTTPTLTTANVQYGSSGTYVYCVIANSDGSGSASTAPASFTVFDNQEFVETPPAATAVTAGGTAIFTVTADGGPLPSFQWRKNTVNLVPGSQTSGSNVSISAVFDAVAHTTTSTLTITNANNNSSGDAGNYDVVVSNTTHVTDTTTQLNSETTPAVALTINKANQTAPTVYATGAMTYGSLYTATTNTGAGATNWSLGTGSTAPGAAIGLTSGVVTSTGLGIVYIKAKFIGDANHNASNYSSPDTSVTVSAAPTTFALNNTSFTYTGSAQGPTITASPGAATFTTGGTTSAIAAGSYTATATATGNYTGSNSSLGWTINKASATVNLGSLAATYDGTPHAATATTTPSGKTVTFTYNGSSTAPTAAGSYAVVGTISDPNYTGTASGTLTIAKATATVALGSLAATYDGTPHAATATTTPSGKTVTFTYNGSSTAPTAAGSYPVVGTVSDANYTGTNSGTLTIAKVPLTVTADPKTRVYGAANPAFTATLSGFVNSETGAVVSGAPSLSSAATATSPVGGYNIVPTIGTLGAANYSFGTFNNGTLTITKATLTVTAANKSRLYGAVNPAFTVAYAGFVNSDNAGSLTTPPTATTTAVLSSPAGVYPITPSGGVAANYSFSYVNGTLTVTPVVAADFNVDGKSDLVWQNTATGDRVVWLMNGTGFASAAALGTISTDWKIVATGDFNQDGQPDLVWQNSVSGECLVWLMNGTVFGSSVSLGTAATQWQIVGTGDFNGDGMTDVLWQNSATGERLAWLMNGTSVASSVSLGVVSTQWSIVGTGDFNADGQTDIVWQNTATGAGVIWLMNGPVFASKVSLGTIPAHWQIAGTGDFNGDGQADLILENLATGERDFWLMNGPVKSSTVVLGVVDPAWKIGRPPAPPPIDDFNGDGNSDLVWQNTATGERSIWLLDGTTFAGSISLGTITTQLQIAALGDFNGDGQTDIVWQNTATGKRVIWLMNGGSLSSSVSLGVVPVQWSIAGAGDFNGDGQTDLLWQNTATGERAIWFMNGTTFASSVSLGTVPVEWSIVAAGDFNRDGHCDILWQDTVTGDCLVWMMSGSTLLSTASLGTAPVQWSIAGTGDFNRDGQPDIVWQNTATGDRLIWLLNGTSFASAVSLGNVPVQWSIRN